MNVLQLMGVTGHSLISHICGSLLDVTSMSTLPTTVRPKVHKTSTCVWQKHAAHNSHSYMRLVSHRYISAPRITLSCCYCSVLPTFLPSNVWSQMSLLGARKCRVTVVFLSHQHCKGLSITHGDAVKRSIIFKKEQCHFCVTDKL